jgi:hypothetical protein
VVGLDHHAILDEVNGQLGAAPEDLVHQALEVRRKVLDDDERHPALHRDVVEEMLERLQPAGRSADPHHVRRRGWQHRAHGLRTRARFD